jgi:hypothetical protein
MLSAVETERIRAALTTFERARENCKDSHVLKVLKAWIDEAKKKLVED